MDKIDPEDQRRIALKQMFLCPGYSILECEIGELMMGLEEEYKAQGNKPNESLGQINFKNGIASGVRSVIGIMQDLREELENSPSGR